MGMTIDEATETIKGERWVACQEKYQEAMNLIETTMYKYQAMQEVLEKVWKAPSCMIDKEKCLNKIMETYRTVR